MFENSQMLKLLTKWFPFVLSLLLIGLIVIIGLDGFFIKGESILKFFFGNFLKEEYLSSLLDERYKYHFERIIRSLFATIAFAVADTFISSKLGIITNDSKNKVPSISPAGLFFSLAMLTWVVQDCFLLSQIWGMNEIDIEEFNDKGLGEYWKSGFSTINSMFFLMGIAHLELKSKGLGKYWNWIQYQAGQPKKIVFWVLIALSISTIIMDVLEGPFTVDSFYSLFTTIIITVGLTIAYQERDARNIIFLPVAMGLCLLFAHLGSLKFEFTLNYQSDYKNFFISLYQYFLILLLFALHITNLGDKKQRELEQQKVETGRTQEAFQAEVEINKPFIETLGKKLPRGIPPKLVLDFIYDQLKKYGIYDYGFCLGVKDKNGDILFPHYYVDGDYRNDLILVEKVEKPYALQCIDGSEELLMESNLEKRPLEDRNLVFFKDARSLIYLKLIKSGKVFGVIGVQSREKNKFYSSEQISILYASARLISNTVDPSIFVSPLVRFLNVILSIPVSVMHEGDSNDLKLGNILSGDENGNYFPAQYEAFAVVLDWNIDDFKSRFYLEPYNRFDPPPLLNEMLKCINYRSLTLGSIFIVALIAFEKVEHKEKYPSNPFLELFRENHESWHKNQRHFREAANLEFSKTDFIKLMETIFELFKEVFRHEDSGFNTIKENGIIVDLENKIIRITLGLKSAISVKKKYEENRRRFENGGKESLKYSVSSKLVLIEHKTKNLFGISISEETDEVTLNFVING